MENLKITEPIARKILSVVDAGLVRGVGQPQPGKMCVEAAVCFAFGLPHDDNPPCVGESVRSFKIKLNDSDWSSNEARAKGMRKIAVAQVGSDAISQSEFIRLVQIGTIKKIVPTAIRAAIQANKKHAVQLEALAVKCETEGTKESAIEARDFLNKIYAADYASYVAAADYVTADYASYVAADAAADYASYVAADAYAVLIGKFTSEKRDEVLTISADIALDALKELKSPGCEFLYLCEA